MPAVVYTATFSGWLNGLSDRTGRIKIVRRIERLADGNAGDHKSVGGGVMELRVTFGPGYRVYYKSYGQDLVVLLAGGDKATQVRDIAKAKALALQREHGDG